MPRQPDDWTEDEHAEYLRRIHEEKQAEPPEPIHPRNDLLEGLQPREWWGDLLGA